MSATSSISPLPQEVLVNIISHFEDDVPTLSRLSLVSRSFCRLVERFLYSTYTQLKQTSSVYPFLRTVLARPDLARLVKCVLLHAWDTKVEEDGRPSPHMTPEFLEAAETTIPAICSQWAPDVDADGERQRRWVEALRQDIEDARVALLLSLLPNLEQLFFEDPWEPFITWNIIEAAGSLPSSDNTDKPGETIAATHETTAFLPLQHLHSFRTFSEDLKYGYLGFEELGRILQLPGMRAFECFAVNGGDDAGNDEDANPHTVYQLPRGSSAVERLSIPFSSMTSGKIQGLLSKFKSLKEFYYSYSPIHMYDRNFTPKELLTALVRHRPSLEVLGANFNDDWMKVGWSDVPFNEVYFGPDLRKFTVLRKLCCSQQAMLGLLNPICAQEWDEDEELTEDDPDTLPRLIGVLPSTLTHLRIEYCDERILSHIEELAATMSEDPEAFPALRVLQLNFTAENSDEDTIEPIDIPGVTVTFGFLEKDDREGHSTEVWWDVKQSMFGDTLNPMFEGWTTAS